MEPESQRSILVCLLTCLLLFLQACEQTSPQPVKIGVILPLSGDFQIYGNAGLRGAEMAVEEINRAGGVMDGRPLELLVTDNRTDPSESIRLARRLIQTDGVVALMGPVSSSARNAVLEEARKHRTPLLYGIDYEGGLYDRYLFCYSTIPDHYITPVIPELLDAQHQSVYVFGYDYVWPHELAKVVDREVERHGGKVVGKEFTRFGVSDFSPTLARIRDSGAQVLVLIQPGQDGFAFIRQLNRANLKKSLRILAIAADESYLQALLPEDSDGIYTGLHFFASLETAKARDFVKRFKKHYGDTATPTYAAESHYGLIHILASAIRQTGSLAREGLIDAMEGASIESGGGVVRVRDDHHFDLPMFLAQFNDGELSVRKSLGLIRPPDQRGD